LAGDPEHAVGSEQLIEYFNINGILILDFLPEDLNVDLLLLFGITSLCLEHIQHLLRKVYAHSRWLLAHASSSQALHEVQEVVLVNHRKAAGVNGLQPNILQLLGCAYKQLQEALQIQKLEPFDSHVVV
jgi:hypothetical protein